MNHRKKILLPGIVVISFALSACGMRGDLYLPEDEARAPEQAAAPAEKVSEDNTGDLQITK